MNVNILTPTQSRPPFKKIFLTTFNYIITDSFDDFLSGIETYLLLILTNDIFLLKSKIKLIYHIMHAYICN